MVRKTGRRVIIVIDGPAGVGKSTTARQVASECSLDYVDSGAMYRGLTYLYLQMGSDSARFYERIENHGLTFDFRENQARVFFSGNEISMQIRSPEVNRHVSRIAFDPRVRELIRCLLRNTVQNRGAVLEGRDLGTVVFPDADLKFFLTADVKTRARRRYDEMIRNGETVSFRQVIDNVKERDHLDSNRTVAPLRKAEDAIEIDSTNMTFEQQVARILDYVREYRKEGSVSGTVSSMKTGNRTDGEE